MEDCEGRGTFIVSCGTYYVSRIALAVGCKSTHDVTRNTSHVPRLTINDKRQTIPYEMRDLGCLEKKRTTLC